MTCCLAPIQHKMPGEMGTYCWPGAEYDMWARKNDLRGSCRLLPGLLLLFVDTGIHAVVMAWRLRMIWHKCLCDELVLPGRCILMQVNFCLVPLHLVYFKMSMVITQFTGTFCIMLSQFDRNWQDALLVSRAYKCRTFEENGWLFLITTIPLGVCTQSNWGRFLEILVLVSSDEVIMHQNSFQYET